MLQPIKLSARGCTINFINNTLTRAVMRILVKEVFVPSLN
jgi:hypothetical protein